MTETTTEISPITDDRNLSIDRMFDIISQVSEPSVWLANFGSVNTKQTYGRSVADFIEKMGVEKPMKSCMG